MKEFFLNQLSNNEEVNTKNTAGKNLSEFLNRFNKVLTSL